MSTRFSHYYINNIIILLEKGTSLYKFSTFLELFILKFFANINKITTTSEKVYRT